MLINKQNKPIFIGTTLLAVMVTSYCMLSSNQGVRTLHKTVLADHVKPLLRSEEGGYQITRDFKHVTRGDEFSQSQEANGGEISQSPETKKGEINKSPSETKGGEFSQSPQTKGDEFNQSPETKGDDFNQSPVTKGGDFNQSPETKGGEFSQSQKAEGGEFSQSQKAKGDEISQSQRAEGGEFSQSQEAIQRERRNRIAEVCERDYFPSRSADVIDKPPFNIIVDHKHKLLFCFIPKIACTSWKRIFLVLKGVINSTDEIDQFAINHHEQKHLNFFFQYSHKRRKHILKKYTKIMFARHPMSRVLSAFTNKLSPDSTFSRASTWQKGIGKEIFEQFHPDSSKEYDLTLRDFVKYLGEEGEEKIQENKHWKEMYKMCAPCDIKYDIIGKLETMNNDAEYILESLNLSDVVELPSSDGSSPTNSSDHIVPYYAQIPKDEIRNFYQRYRFDFELFGYNIPNEIQGT